MDESLDCFKRRLDFYRRQETFQILSRDFSIIEREPIQSLARLNRASVSKSNPPQNERRLVFISIAAQQWIWVSRLKTSTSKTIRKPKWNLSKDKQFTSQKLIWNQFRFFPLKTRFFRVSLKWLPNKIDFLGTGMWIYHISGCFCLPRQ